MNSLKRWLHSPKRSDSSLLAQFFFADEDLNSVAAELDSFEGRKDPERCTTLVNQLRTCQAKVLNIIFQMMEETVKEERAPRDFRVKFPDDVIQDNLAGQLWFGAECLAAGSSIMNREVESAAMRPLARALTKNLDSLRTILRDHCLKSVQEYSRLIRESLVIFDKLFAEFELSYVSAMVPVKSAHEYDMIQEITVLFSETVQRSVSIDLLTQDTIDEYDPALMFTIPRLAIISGLLVFKDGPLNPDNDPWNISEMFRPFQTLLIKIRELLTILTEEELWLLESALCSQAEPSFLATIEQQKQELREEKKNLLSISRQKNQGDATDKRKREESEGDDNSIESELTAFEIAERLEALAQNFESSRSSQTEHSTSQASASEWKETEAGSGTKKISASSSTDSLSSSTTNSEDDCVDDCSQRSKTDLKHEGGKKEKKSSGHGDIDKSVATSSAGQVLGSDASPIKAVASEERGDTASLACLPQPDNGPSPSALTPATPPQHTAASTEDIPFSIVSSTDSGLFSDLLSQSDSLFTISSSDSHQQLVTSQSVATVDSPTDNTTTTAGITNKDCHTHQTSSDKPVPHKDTKHVSIPEDQECVGGGSSVNGERGDAARQQSEDTVRGLSEEVRKTVATLSQLKDSNVHSDSVISEKRDDGQSSDCSSCVAVSEQNECDEHPETSGDVATHPCTNTATTSNRQESCANCDNMCASIDTTNTTNSNGLCLSAPEEKKARNLTSSQNCCKNQNERSVLDHGASTSRADQASTSSDPSQQNGSLSKEKGCVGKESAPKNATLQGSGIEDQSLCEIPPTNPSLGASAAIPITADTNANKTENPQTIVANQTGDGTKSKDLQSKASSTTGNGKESSSSQLKRAGRVKKKKSHSRCENSGSHNGASTSGALSKALKLPSIHSSKVDALKHLADGEGGHSSDTSSYTSDSGDREEIALAMEAAETATRKKVRAQFHSSSDMIHRLFVCISGVADQLQTNYAGDLRNILRAVFDMHCSQRSDMGDSEKLEEATPLGAAYRAIRAARRARNTQQRQEPPVWIPDEEATECMSCQVPFTFVRRRHHCRNCGKIYCSRCSSNFVPLPHLGQEKAVRVCNRCFMFRVTPFTVRS